MKFTGGISVSAVIGMATLVSLPCASAFFRMSCDGPLVRVRYDPIVDPGVPSGHLHTIVGGNAFDFVMDGKKAHTATCTSCQVKQDKSNYWTPDLWARKKNGKFEPVKHGGATVYYLQRDGPNKDTLVPFPDDFRMLAGNPLRRSFSGSAEDIAISWVCLNNGGTSYDIPNKRCAAGLRAQVRFPSCWDGKNSDSPNHKSHMAYPIGGENGPCPPTHPKRFITLFMEVIYSSEDFKDDYSNGKHPFVLSNGDPTGYGLHGDFINGWEPAVLKEAIKCDNNSGRVEDCKVLKLNTPDERDRCKIAPSVNEETEGILDKLPGCNPVQPGPKDAIPPPNCNAPKTIGQPKTYSSDMSKKGFTYVGCAFDNLDNRVFSERKGDAKMTIEMCLDHCTSKNFAYAGLQYGTECWCGNKVEQKVLGSVQCTMQCGGNASQYCGGSKKLSIYKKDPKATGS